MQNIRARSVWLCLFMVAGFLISCTPKSTPPGANSFGDTVDRARYSYHYWEEGLSVLIWHDLTFGGESCSGTGSTEDPIYILECNVEGYDGRQFSWTIHSSDGVTADMWIEDQSFDLSKGTMFLVNTKDDGFQVEQLFLSRKSALKQSPPWPTATRTSPLLSLPSRLLTIREAPTLRVV